MKWYFRVFQQYAIFNGRARRKEYWYFVLFNLLVSFTLALVAGVTQMPLFYYVYVLAALVPSIAVAVRRMHDVGKSGWFCIVPIYNLVLACTNGETGENQYGADPKTGAHHFDFERAGDA